MGPLTVMTLLILLGKGPLVESPSYVPLVSRLVIIFTRPSTLQFFVACEPALRSYQFATDFYKALIDITSGIMLPLTTAGVAHLHSVLANNDRDYISRLVPPPPIFLQIKPSFVGAQIPLASALIPFPILSSLNPGLLFSPRGDGSA
jgi:hypothetical protein